MTRYAVDVDGVLALQIEATLARINMRYGTNYTKDDMVAWDAWNLIPELKGSRNEFYRAMGAAWEAGEVQADPSASEMMRNLRLRGRVDIVTKTIAEDDTLRFWLAANGIVYDGLVHLPKGSQVSKAAFTEYDVFIDDSPKLAEEMPADKTLLLVDQPWNRNVPVRRNVRRIGSLMEAAPSGTGWYAQRHAVQARKPVSVRRHLRRTR